MSTTSCEHQSEGICVACYDPDAVRRYAEKTGTSFEEAAEQMRSFMDDYGLEVDDTIEG